VSDIVDILTNLCAHFPIYLFIIVVMHLYHNIGN
jgi:hypothetical protein